MVVLLVKALEMKLTKYLKLKVKYMVVLLVKALEMKLTKYLKLKVKKYGRIAR